MPFCGISTAIVMACHSDVTLASILSPTLILSSNLVSLFTKICQDAPLGRAGRNGSS